SPDVKAAVSCLTGFAYRPFYDKVAEINSMESSGMPEILNPPFSISNRRQKYLSYYDTMNFASRVKCPVIVLACLCDRVTPATTVYASFRSLKNTASKIFFSPNTNHDFIIAFEKIAWRWLEENLK
ncbi:MAG TPA: acetylxylan esterase, partial [bacterium]|nr:acetylxylan esterase [bacterium]